MLLCLGRASRYRIGAVASRLIPSIQIGWNTVNDHSIPFIPGFLSRDGQAIGPFGVMGGHVPATGTRADDG